MRTLRDFRGLAIRLTDERLAHFLEHPEMAGLEESIAKTLESPEYVYQSLSDDQARLYYRFYVGTKVGDKFLCVVVKVVPGDAFVLTAYLTDKPKTGVQLWSKSG